MAAHKGVLWGCVQDMGKTCGFVQEPQPPPMWVRASPDLFPQEIPGMSEELLNQMNTPGGSLEEKLLSLVETFRFSARHLESMQHVLRRRALDRRGTSADPFPHEVAEVIANGTYLDSFLEAFDGQSFPLHSDEIVPGHEYCLALEVHTGGAYWSSIPVHDAGTMRQKVETVSASAPGEGSASVISHFGAAQRGAVFVWRWKHLLDHETYNLPEWLARCLRADGNDPLRKLLGELEALRRWEQQVRLNTAQYVKQGAEIKDPYIREVLRLWPSEADPHGCGQLKKCAWVEGLDPRLFVGRNVLVVKVSYDETHALVLHASISKRHMEDPPQQTNPPYRLTTTWQWAASRPLPPPPPAPAQAPAPTSATTMCRPTRPKSRDSPVKGQHLHPHLSQDGGLRSQSMHSQLSQDVGPLRSQSMHSQLSQDAGPLRSQSMHSQLSQDAAGPLRSHSLHSGVYSQAGEYTRPSTISSDCTQAAHAFGGDGMSAPPSAASLRPPTSARLPMPPSPHCGRDRAMPVDTYFTAAPATAPQSPCRRQIARSGG